MFFAEIGKDLRKIKVGSVHGRLRAVLVKLVNGGVPRTNTRRVLQCRDESAGVGKLACLLDFYGRSVGNAVF